MAEDRLTVCEQKLLQTFAHLVSISSNFLLLSIRQTVPHNFVVLNIADTKWLNDLLKIHLIHEEVLCSLIS